MPSTTERMDRWNAAERCESQGGLGEGEGEGSIELQTGRVALISSSLLSKGRALTRTRLELTEIAVRRVKVVEGRAKLRRT